MIHYTSFNTKLLNYTAGLICIFVLAYFGVNLYKTDKVSDKYKIYVAYFSNGEGLTPKTPVMLSGYKVGSIQSISLDKHYRVYTLVAVRKDIAIPDDSSLNVKEDGFFGNKVVQLNLGVSEDYLSNKDTISDTGTGISLVRIVDLLIDYVGKLKYENQACHNHRTTRRHYSAQKSSTSAGTFIKMSEVQKANSQSKTTQVRKTITIKETPQPKAQPEETTIITKTITQATEEHVAAQPKPQLETENTHTKVIHHTQTSHRATAHGPRAVTHVSHTTHVTKQVIHKTPKLIKRTAPTTTVIVTTTKTTKAHTLVQSSRPAQEHTHHGMVVKPLAPIVTGHVVPQGNTTSYHTTTIVIHPQPEAKEAEPKPKELKTKKDHLVVTHKKVVTHRVVQHTHTTDNIN